ncbi:MAG: ATP-binding protein [Pseudomonadota bacterium]
MNAATRAWRRLRHSLRARLTLLFLLLALAMTLIFVGGVQAVMRSGWQELARPLIADYVDQLTAEIGTPPDVRKAEAIARRLPLRIRIEGPVVNWSTRSGEADDGWRERDRHRRDAERPPSPWRPVRELADGHRVRFGLASLPRDDAPEDRARLIGWATLLAMLALVAATYAWVRALLRPLADIRAGAIRYGAGDFSEPIPTRSPDELGELARQVNGMADGLHGLLDAKRDLLLAISHELRSPLTRARLNAELVDEGTARDALLRDLGEMRDLITDLLESERLAGGHAALHTEPVDLNALVREVVAQQFADRLPKLPLAHDVPTLALAPDAPRLALDATRIRLLLRNLLDNARRHSADAAQPPVVTTTFDAAGATLRVRDHGPGVDEAQLPLLAQAFYRPDSARRRATGGVGLGLYLCRLVAQAHGGTMTLRNAHPGLQIDIHLPVQLPRRDR